ncbi:hypothetical protein [Roseiflexus castenholzii]|uniref:hypothetical protein n=1 Tax=Roseiflexus castenholzii TaxID=120962 RepID=UPI003C7CDDFF
MTGNECELIATKKLAQELTSFLIVVKTGSGRKNAQFGRVWRETESREQQAQNVSHFGSGSAAVRMKFIDDQKEHSFGMVWLSQPLPCLFKDVTLNSAHQHNIQHRVIGNQNIRRRLLHIPA